MSASYAPITRRALNPHHLARQAILNHRLLPEITHGLEADKPRVKYGCAKALRLISEERPDVLYPHFGFFANLLDHENKILQWDATFVLSQLARADAQDEFAAIFEKYFSPITGPVMITAANAIQGGARVAQAKPKLADRIAAEILKVTRARYSTPECRNVAIGHAIVALQHMLPLLSNPASVVEFVRKQVRNPRPATRKKAEHFLSSHAPLPRPSRRRATLPP
jgi:hypothetical protein